MADPGAMAQNSSSDRRARIARMRARIAVATVALFAGSLGAVVAWGRQPASSGFSSAGTPADATSGDDGSVYGYDDGSGGSTAQQAPAPLTTQQS